MSPIPAPSFWLFAWSTLLIADTMSFVAREEPTTKWADDLNSVIHREREERLPIADPLALVEKERVIGGLSTRPLS